MDITWVVPQPERVEVGARAFLASPLRLRDLARLQNYVRGRRDCPLDAAAAGIFAAPEGSERRRRALRDAYLACEGWPDRVGSPEGRAAFATLEGLKAWLAIVLDVDNPPLDPAVLDEIAREMTVEQHDRLVRIAYGVAPLDELSRLISPDSFPDRSNGRPTNWGKIAVALAREFGWTFDQIAEVRLTQLAAIETGGDAGSGKCPVPPGMSPGQFRRRQKAFFGPDRDDTEEAADGD